MDVRYVKWLLPLFFLAAFRLQSSAQTKTAGNIVVVSDTARWTWEATAGEEKSFSFTVDMSGDYRVYWGNGDMDDYRIDGVKTVSHQYSQAGSYVVKLFGLPPDTIPQRIVDTAFGIRMELVYVKGGTFRMGATPEQGSAAHDREKPVHEVTLDGFYIGRFEVTQGQWEAVMGTTVKQQRDLTNSNYSLSGVGDDYPMYYVSWKEAVAFCDSLSARTGRKHRLPTEAEWEYAARGGQQSDGTKYAGSNTIGNVAWYYTNSFSKTHPVGQKQPNGLELYDMSGNALEWCSDLYGDYNEDVTHNPQGPSSGSGGRVYRGGSWLNYERECRVSSRIAAFPDYRDNLLGFRVVCEL